MHHANLSGLEIASISPALAPRRFPEEFIGFVHLTLILQGEGKVIKRLAIVWVRIALDRQLVCFAQIFLGLCKTTLADEPQTHSIQTTDIIRITAQSLLVVIQWIPSSMTVLLQMTASDEQLLVGLNLLRQQGSLGTVGDRTNLVALGMPAEHGTLTIDEGLLNLKRQFVHLGTLYIDGLYEYSLR